MAQSVPLVLRVLASSVTVASRAGKIIRDVMSRGELGIVDKGVNDLQTEADRSAQRCIIASLTKQFPAVTIIGEEGPSNCEVPSDWLVTDSDESILSLTCPPHLTATLPSDITIWVDPLDGTAEYTQGLLDHVTVLIGLAVKGQPVAGVIHQPYYGVDKTKTTEGESETVVCARGGRTLWGLVGGAVGGFEAQPPPEGKLIVVTTRSHSDGLVQKALDGLGADEVIRVGGAGYKVMLLLEGGAHAYVFASPGCKKWDTCAPQAVLAALGGRLTDINGEDYQYDPNAEHPNRRGVIATAKGYDHARIIKLIPDDVKSALSK